MSKSRKIYDYDWINRHGRRLHGPSAVAFPNTFNSRVSGGFDSLYRGDESSFLFIFPIEEGKDDD